MLRLKGELVANIDTVEGLRDALQNAIMLEHATIPTYLYALYSIKPADQLPSDQDQHIADLIMSIVLEEMTHMAMACNILNAIGGSPQINVPEFIPTYPGPLPGGVESGLQVRLAPLSLDLIMNVFMEIECPEHPENFPVGDAAPADGADGTITNGDVAPADGAEGTITIGEFYHAIQAQIQTFGDSIFYKDSSWQNRQVTFAPTVDTNNPSQSAIKLIEQIVEQGEGTSTSPMENPTDPTNLQLAHYYRFAEIYYGKTLVKDPNPLGYAYKGDPLVLDTGGVLPLVTNPKAADYADDPEALLECNEFNSQYSTLLDVLHATFNGSPELMARAAFTLMPNLTKQAAILTAIQLKNGQHAGPSFEYSPPSP